MLPPAESARPHLAQRMLAAGCALAVWLLGVFAVSPELHAHVHADTTAADHACAITLFQQGAENPTDVVSLSVAPVAFAETAPKLAEGVAPTGVDLRLEPSCGPPQR